MFLHFVFYSILEISPLCFPSPTLHLPPVDFIYLPYVFTFDYKYIKRTAHLPFSGAFSQSAEVVLPGNCECGLDTLIKILYRFGCLLRQQSPLSSFWAFSTPRSNHYGAKPMRGWWEPPCPTLPKRDHEESRPQRRQDCNKAWGLKHESALGEKGDGSV